MARPRKQIDIELVKQLASIHCTMDEIGAVVGCSRDTLEHRFSAVIKDAREKGRASLRRMQYLKAKDGNVTMMIWLGKQLLGQSDHATYDVNENLKIASLAELLIAANNGAFSKPGGPLNPNAPGKNGGE